MSDSRVPDNRCVESRPHFRSINNLSSLTEGADGAYLGATTPGLAAGATTDSLPDLDLVSSFVAGIDFDNAVTTVQNNLNPPDQNIAGQTDHGFVDFYTMVTDPVNLSLSFSGEGAVFILVDEGNGFNEVARQVGPLSHAGTGENSGVVTHTLTNQGITRVRFVQIDIEGSANLWVYNGDPITTYAPSSGTPLIENKDVLRDCEGNYFELDGTPVAGTVLPPQPPEAEDISQPSEYCPSVVSLTDLTGPANMNPAVEALLTWGASSSTDNSVIAASGASRIEVVADNVCLLSLSARAVVANLDGGAGITGNSQRANPILRMYKIRGGTETEVDLDQIYIRDATAADSGTLKVFFEDSDSLQGDVYELRVVQDNMATVATGQAAETIEIFSTTSNKFQAVAHRRILTIN